VQRGDTLSGIARLFDVTVTEIAVANDIASVDVIYEGQRLVIPKP
jgi:LysM repeat protein